MTKTKSKNGNVPKIENGKEVLRLYEKQFIPRNSLLTDLYNISHILCIYRIFAAALFMLYVRSILVEIVEGRTLTFGTEYIVKGFRDFHNVIFSWVFMFSITLLLYPGFCFWAKLRTSLVKKSLLRIWNTLWIFGVIIYCVCIIYIPLKCRGVPDAMGNNLIILTEQVRFIMKAHAFIRSNAPRVLSYKPHTEQNLVVPTFSSFLYYYFAPTFIYRDNYPRTEKIHLKTLLQSVIEFVGALFWFSFLIDAVVIRYKDFGLKPETWLSLVLHQLETMLIAPFIFISGFYTLLHIWMNIWAEMLRFADRQFYEDWWNSTNFSNFYRTWNLVVHGYLHTYIYKDMLKYITPGNKIISSCCVVLISGLVHEYIISYTFGFFMPILFIHFGILSLPLSFVRLKHSVFSNCFFVWGIICGTGIETSFYAMEYFARQNCPSDSEGIGKYFELRMWSCNGFNLKLF